MFKRNVASSKPVTIRIYIKKTKKEDYTTMACNTCGSTYYQWFNTPADAVKCKCGFTDELDICLNPECYSRYPRDDCGDKIQLLCPNCNLFIGFYYKDDLPGYNVQF
ncbi:hypothetical protein BGP_1217 [Beggiatoa sp. PS]|nr:hypothetical protein BGP_1217 [Beggiatoa sp. PS]